MMLVKKICMVLWVREWCLLFSYRLHCTGKGRFGFRYQRPEVKVPIPGMDGQALQTRLCEDVESQSENRTWGQLHRSAQLLVTRGLLDRDFHLKYSHQAKT